jgi:hypothetical protein
MAAVDTTSRPPITAPLADTEEKAKLQEAENAKNQELNNLVRREASNEEVYKALENFLQGGKHRTRKSTKLSKIFSLSIPRDRFPNLAGQRTK